MKIDPSTYLAFKVMGVLLLCSVTLGWIGTTLRGSEFHEWRKDCASLSEPVFYLFEADDGTITVACSYQEEMYEAVLIEPQA